MAAKRKKKNRKRKPLTPDQSKDLLAKLAKSLIGLEIEEAACALGRSKATIHAMKREGVGNAATYLQLISHYLELDNEDLDALIENLPTYFADKPGIFNTPTPKELPLSERLFNEVQKYTDENELVGWLNLLLAKVQIEASIGTRRKLRRKPKGRSITISDLK